MYIRPSDHIHLITESLCTGPPCYFQYQGTTHLDQGSLWDMLLSKDEQTDLELWETQKPKSTMQSAAINEQMGQELVLGTSVQ